jgi:transposase-like protein
MAQICSKFNIHPTQARRWREIALANLKNSFNGKTINQQLETKDQLIDELYKQIGHLKVSLDWLKKKLGISIES